MPATKIWSAMMVILAEAKNLGLLSLWTLILLGVVLLSPLQADYLERSSGTKNLPSREAMDFDACARLAIRQSPFLTKSNLEIKIRRLDEIDSKTDFIPSFNLRTRYYVNTLPGQTGNSPYYIDFISDPYNPVELYFNLQVRKIVTKIAILNHLKVISEGLHRLGSLFLQMDALRQVAKAETEIIQLAEKNLVYSQERQKIGESNALELKIASQGLELARMNHKKILDGQRKNQESIRKYLAWPVDQHLSFDLPGSRMQILGNFDASTVAPESLASSTFDFKIQALYRELQKYNISLARARLLPTFYLGVVTPDPLSGVQSRNFFAYAAAFVPLWDGLKRVRNITRQKTVLKQLDADTDAKETDFIDKWRESQENLADAATQLKMGQSQLELAMLKAKQSEVRYHQFGEPFSVYLEGEKGIIEARKIVIWKTLDYDQAKLALRFLANDLVSHYVNENSLPKHSEDK